MVDTVYQRLKFEKAIAYLRDKLGIGSDRWDELWNETQDYVFAIAGVESALVLQAVQDKLVQILEGRSQGVDTFKDFANTFQQSMQSAGYGAQSPWRTRMVYTTNIRQAYNAGRYQQLIEEDHPNEYVQYWHGDPIVPRPAHKALHQRVFRKDDPILKTIAPSNGWGCTCRIMSLSDRDLKREGLKVADPIAETITIKDKLTGKTQKVPAITVNGAKYPIAEPGFTTAPGASKNREEVLRSALERLSPKLRSQAESAIKKRYPEFSEIDFAYNPDQPRDKDGRFAKKSGLQSKTQPRSTYKAIAPPKKGSAEYNGIKSQLSDWTEAGRQLEKIAPDIYRSNSGIVGSIASEFDKNHRQFRAVMDSEGEMQAAGIVTKGKRSLLVRYLATSPFNMYGKDAKRGAGTALMSSLIKESIDSGFDGRIRLDAVPKAIPFYEKIGFKAINPRDNVVKTMELSPEDAKQFLSRFESNFSEQTGTDSEYLDELERLEQEAGYELAIALSGLQIAPDDEEQADEVDFSYNPDQPRDENGRFAKKSGSKTPKNKRKKRSESEPEVDPRYTYDAIMQRGEKLVEALSKEMSEPLSDEHLKIAEEIKATVIAQGVSEDEANAYVNSFVLNQRNANRMQRFKDNLIKDYGISKDEAEKIVDGISFDGVKPRDRKKLREMAIASFQLTGGKVASTLQKYTQNGGRAYASELAKEINIGRKPSIGTILHEHGHHIEFVAPTAAASAREWRDRRATGEETKLSDITDISKFEEHERGVPGNFVHPYVGKVYPIGYTEVIAVGLEAFVDGKHMAFLYNRDPDHFKFMVGVLSAEDRSAVQ